MEPTMRAHANDGDRSRIDSSTDPRRTERTSSHAVASQPRWRREIVTSALVL